MSQHLQRYNPSGAADEDTLRRSPGARLYAQNLRDRDALIAAQAREQRELHDQELAEAAREARLKDSIIDISTPELADEARKQGLV